MKRVRRVRMPKLTGGNAHQRRVWRRFLKRNDLPIPEWLLLQKPAESLVQKLERIEIVVSVANVLAMAEILPSEPMVQSKLSRWARVLVWFDRQIEIGRGGNRRTETA